MNETEELEDIDFFVCPWCGQKDDIHDSQCELSDTFEFDLDEEDDDAEA